MKRIKILILATLLQGGLWAGMVSGQAADAPGKTTPALRETKTAACQQLFSQKGKPHCPCCPIAQIRPVETKSGEGRPEAYFTRDPYLDAILN